MTPTLRSEDLYPVLPFSSAVRIVAQPRTAIDEFDSETGKGSAERHESSPESSSLPAPPKPAQKARSVEYMRRYREKNAARLREWRVAYYRENRERIRAAAKNRRQENTVANRIKRRSHYEKNRDRILAYHKKHYAEYRGREAAKGRLYRIANRERIRERNKTLNRQRKMIVLSHYGGTPPSCACCGERGVDFLTLDHVHGRGKAHRRELGRTGNALYQYLVSHDFPTDVEFQVLCFNCNCAKGFVGKCPHQEKKK